MLEHNDISIKEITKPPSEISCIALINDESKRSWAVLNKLFKFSGSSISGVTPP